MATELAPAMVDALVKAPIAVINRSQHTYTPGFITRHFYEVNEAEKHISERTLPGDETSHEQNGTFVHAAIDAWIHGQCLVIGPDDIWIAILSQIRYMLQLEARNQSGRDRQNRHEKHGEIQIKINQLEPELKHHKVTLSLSMPEEVPRWTDSPDNSLSGSLSRLRQWATMDFSTSTEADQTLAYKLLIPPADNQKRPTRVSRRYVYPRLGKAHIPRFRILGTDEDWRDIGSRLTTLTESLPGLATYACLLQPIVSSLHKARNLQEPCVTDTFLTSIVRDGSFYEKRGACAANDSGSIITGWITAFCVANERKNMMSKQGADLNYWRGEELGMGCCKVAATEMPWAHVEDVPDVMA